MKLHLKNYYCSASHGNPFLDAYSIVQKEKDTCMVRKNNMAGDPLREDMI